MPQLARDYDLAHVTLNDIPCGTLARLFDAFRLGSVCLFHCHQMPVPSGTTSQFLDCGKWALVYFLILILLALLGRKRFTFCKDCSGNPSIEGVLTSCFDQWLSVHPERGIFLVEFPAQSYVIMIVMETCCLISGCKQKAKNNLLSKDPFHFLNNYSVYMRHDTAVQPLCNRLCVFFLISLGCCLKASCRQLSFFL